jgi:hypothetical protein
MSTQTTTQIASSTATVVESVPITWSAADEQFFRIVGELLDPRFLAGASVLLASYDEV